MAITIKEINELRKKTQAGLMDCKKALEANDGDMDKAVEFLREKGLATQAKKSGRAAAEDFMQKLKVAAIETHVADARTCCLHPASSTHRQMTDEELADAGVSPDLVRLSCGIEDAEDLIADLEQALK